mgnify:CR=1 FL=1
MKKRKKRIDNLFGDQNQNPKYSIVLKQSISRPATPSTQFDALWECYAEWAKFRVRQLNCTLFKSV